MSNAQFRKLGLGVFVGSVSIKTSQTVDNGKGEGGLHPEVEPAGVISEPDEVAAVAGGAVGTGVPNKELAMLLTVEMMSSDTVTV